MLLIYLLLVIIGLVLLYLLLWTIVPKGFLIQEILSLPHFWWQIWQTPIDRMKVQKRSYGSHRRQYLLCCEPILGGTNRQEVVVYYHGGGWIFGTPEQFQSNAQFFVDLGYTVFIPSYRRIPRFSYPHIDHDLEQTLVQIQQIKKEKGLEKARILLAGMSAGGNLVALMAYDRNRLSRIGLHQRIFSGILLFGAPLDLQGMYNSLPLLFFAGRRSSAQFRQANPRFHLQEEEDIPLCCIHGEKDGMVPLQAAQGFIRQLEKRQKNNLRYEVLKNGSHLDSGSWVYADNEVRGIILEWLRKTDRLATLA